jgi:hypothetical protein
LKELDFPEFVDPLKSFLEKYRVETIESSKKGAKPKKQPRGKDDEDDELQKKVLLKSKKKNRFSP